MRWTAQLPEELVVEILSRLPVKPLLRFRCVSRQWRSLIDNSSFVKLHMLKNRNSKISVFINWTFGRGGMAGIRLQFAEVDLVNCSDRIQSLTLPLLSPPETRDLCGGSCEGLFWVSTKYYKKIYFVNPSTREYSLLPTPIGSSTWSRRHCYVPLGLGYDCSEDEYKFVLMSRSRSKVQIYGSKSNAWRQKDFSFNYSISLSLGRYAHSALHWKASEDEKHSSAKSKRVRIVAFNFVSEKLTVSEYDTDLFGNPSYIALEVLGGQLSLCCRHYLGQDRFVADIWVMEEYGVRESWSKLVSFDRDVEPLAFSSCGSRLLFRVIMSWPCRCTFHWYDLNTKSMECTHTGMHPYFGLCIQSLIRLEGKLC